MDLALNWIVLKMVGRVKCTRERAHVRRGGDIVNRGAGKNRRRKERFFRSEVRAGKGVGTLYPCPLSCDYCASVVDNASCWETRSSLLTLQLSSCE